MPLPTGTQLGPYEILGLLGKGGMGEVYRCRDSRLDRIVALKVLNAELAADRAWRQRFEQEAKAVASLNHPNVVATYDVGTHDGNLFIVFELLQGETLRARLGSGTIPVRKTLELAVQIARGLAAAHRKGIAHRDLKPENLFIARDGQLKIVDFGLAKLSAPRSSLDSTELMTSPGVVMGTVGYMSPEQVRGEAADHRSDIFSFGVVLHEMLSGTRPFRGESQAEVLQNILSAAPPDLPDSAAPQLGLIVKRCLEKSPEERFDSARDLTFALEALSGDTRSQTLTSPPPAKGAFRKLLAAAGLAFIFLAGALIAHQFWRSTESGNSVPRYLTYSGRDYSPAVSPDGKTVAFASDRDGKSRIWLKQIIGDSEVALTSGDDDHPRFSPDGSTILFSRRTGSRISLYRVGNLGGDTRRIIDDAASGDFSPDGRRVAFARWKGDGPKVSTALGIVGVDGSDPKEIAEAGGTRLDFPRWSPDGAHIAVLSGLQGGFVRPDLLVVSADGRNKRFLKAPGFSLGRSAVAWVTNDEIAYLHGDRSASSSKLVRQNVRSGASQVSDWPHQGQVFDITGSGALVFDAQSGRSNLRELRLSGKVAAEGQRWMTRGNTMDRQPAYSPDGTRILFSSGRSGNIEIWQIATDTGSLSRLTDHPGTDSDPAFTPDGKGLIWSSNRSGNWEIHLADAEGGGARQVTNDGFDAENPTMTADGRWIVYSSAHKDKLGIWKIHPDGSGAMRIGAGSYFNPEVSPDGQYALYVTTIRPDRNAIRVLRIADGAQVPFEIVCDIQRQVDMLVGRARWLPGGGAIVFVGQDEKGVNGIYSQDFVPGKDTSASRRAIGGFDPETATETLGISPDGTRMSISGWERVSSVMIADRVPGIPRLFKLIP